MTMHTLERVLRPGYLNSPNMALKAEGFWRTAVFSLWWKAKEAVSRQRGRSTHKPGVKTGRQEEWVYPWMSSHPGHRWKAQLTLEEDFPLSQSFQ